MIARASGSNSPMPQPTTTYDYNKNPKYWKRKEKAYLLDQLKLSGFDPPHPDTKNNKGELIQHLFLLRGTRPIGETSESEEQSKKKKPPKRAKHLKINSPSKTPKTPKS